MLRRRACSVAAFLLSYSLSDGLAAGAEPTRFGNATDGLWSVAGGQRRAQGSNGKGQAAGPACSR